MKRKGVGCLLEKDAVEMFGVDDPFFIEFPEFCFIEELFDRFGSHPGAEGHLVKHLGKTEENKDVAEVEVDGFEFHGFLWLMIQKLASG